MKQHLIHSPHSFILTALTFLVALSSHTFAAPLRVLVSSDAESFRTEYTGALKTAGVVVTASAVPDAASLAEVDVALLQRVNFDALLPDAQAALANFAKRGGGIIAVNGAVAAGDVAWGKAVLGGAWDAAQSRKFRSTMMLYVRTDSHPIVAGASTFDMNDDTLYDLALDPKVFVLGSAFTPKVTDARNSKRSEKEKARLKDDRASIYDIQPQMWAFEDATHRAAVVLPGAEETLKHASIRSFILRGVAWAAKRAKVDELCAKADLATLRYPAGGPRRAEDAIGQFEMQPGFRASVVASEPLISKPIAVQWDARGRMWVAETPEYPNGRRPLTAEAWKESGVLEPDRYDRPARDTISILEDTNGDGVLDKKAVFHTGLELVTGFCFYRDGVIAVAQPNIVWLRDTDGDGKADKEVPLFGGFTPKDTHFVANHFIIAPDGWIYASTGSGATATKPATDEVVARISPGVFRFKPDGSAMEQVASLGGNTFGAEVTSDMEIWHGKATTGNPLQHVVLPEWVLAKGHGRSAASMQAVNPGRTVARADLPDRAPLMQIDRVGGYSAACSSLVYEGGAWPAEYNGMILCTEPILDIIHVERMKPAGPTFTGELVLEDKEWLRSRDHFFCPIDITIGPDGAMVVLDFYTPVVAHNDPRGAQPSKSGASVRPDREHYFGRIYRIQSDSAPKLPLPDLTKADGTALVAAFMHPNRVVRFNAMRVLMENADTLGAAARPALVAMLGGKSTPARILALWALERLGKLTPEEFDAALHAAEPEVRKNALLIAESGRIALSGAQATAALDDPDARVRLTALSAMSAAKLSADAGAALLAAQARLDDPWSRAAASAAASSNPGAQLAALLQRGDTGEQSLETARSLGAAVAEKADTAAILALAESAVKSPALAAAALSAIGQRIPAAPSDAAPTLAALRPLLSSPDRALTTAALPLVAAWDKTGTLKPEMVKLTTSLLSFTADAAAPAAERIAAIRALLTARAASPEILSALLARVRQPQPDAFRRDLITALAATGDAAVGRALADAFPGLPTVTRDTAFDALISRAAWAGLLLDALDAKNFAPSLLGPTQTSRLTAHPDATTAQRAKKLFAALGTGTNPAKDDIIAKLLPAVEKPGNIANGKALFAACAVCHKLAGEGQDFGPNLDGIGSHPVAELLMHIVDPSRAVDDEHRTWNIAMKDGTQYSALIGSENDAVVKTKMPGGVTIELKTADIATRAKAANSLMPEGLEALGAEALRDIIAYIQSAAPKLASTSAPTKRGPRASAAPAAGPRDSVIVPAAQLHGPFRPLDLSAVVTADTRKGLYTSADRGKNTVPLEKFGKVDANGVPFEILDAAKSAGGKNILVLKGGPENAVSRTMAQRVEIPVGTAASRLHFLSGVAGWGAVHEGDGTVLTATLHFADGATQVVRLRTGQEFADYIRRMEVPGSQFAAGIVSDGKNIRTFAIPVKEHGVIEKLVLESTAGKVAPTIVAITAELGAPDTAPTVAQPAGETSNRPRRKAPANNDPNDRRTTAPTGQKFAEPKPSNTLRVLLVGAGQSHDFPRYFLGADSVMLKAAGGIDTAATPNLVEALALLPQADVLVFSGNHASFGTPRFQAALNKFADEGKGLVMLHAGVWRNWSSLASGYNRRFVGGGAKGHGKGEFEVTLKNSAHPLMAGVPATFKITDENYHVTLDGGTPVEVLAENAPDGRPPAPHPSVWIVKDAKTRIACISLGHADEAHSNPAFKTLLTNAVKWAGSREK